MQTTISIRRCVAGSRRGLALVLSVFLSLGGLAAARHLHCRPGHIVAAEIFEAFKSGLAINQTDHTTFI